MTNALYLPAPTLIIFSHYLIYSHRDERVSVVLPDPVYTQLHLLRLQMMPNMDGLTRLTFNCPYFANTMITRCIYCLNNALKEHNFGCLAENMTCTIFKKTKQQYVLPLEVAYSK